MKKTIMTTTVVVVFGLAAWLVYSFYIDKSVPEESVVEENGAVTENSLVVTLFEEVEVANDLLASTNQENVKTFNGIEFTLTPTPNHIIAGEETILRFNLVIDGRPASDMQTQSGVYGKSVAVHKESLEIVTVDIVRRVTPHGTLEFRTIFPRSGEYKIFTQFKRNGEIVTTDFDVSVR